MTSFIARVFNIATVHVTTCGRLSSTGVQQLIRCAVKFHFKELKRYQDLAEYLYTPEDVTYAGWRVRALMCEVCPTSVNQGRARTRNTEPGNEKFLLFFSRSRRVKTFEIVQFIEIPERVSISRKYCSTTYSMFKRAVTRSFTSSRAIRKSVFRITSRKLKRNWKNVVHRELFLRVSYKRTRDSVFTYFVGWRTLRSSSKRKLSGSRYFRVLAHLYGERSTGRGVRNCAEGTSVRSFSKFWVKSADGSSPKIRERVCPRVCGLKDEFSIYFARKLVVKFSSCRVILHNLILYETSKHLP